MVMKVLDLRYIVVNYFLNLSDEEMVAVKQWIKIVTVRVQSFIIRLFPMRQYSLDENVEGEL